MDKASIFLEKNYVNFIFLVSLFSVVGSLYYSNVEGLEPCTLCWYARIFIYPLLPLSLVSLIFNKKLEKLMVLSLTIPGMFLTLYHYSVQKFGVGKQFLNCTKSTPCDTIDVQYLGFITIPLLAFGAFFAINLVIFLTFRKTQKLN